MSIKSGIVPVACCSKYLIHVFPLPGTETNPTTPWLYAGLSFLVFRKLKGRWISEPSMKVSFLLHHLMGSLDVEGLATLLIFSLSASLSNCLKIRTTVTITTAQDAYLKKLILNPLLSKNFIPETVKVSTL